MTSAAAPTSAAALSTTVVDRQARARGVTTSEPFKFTWVNGRRDERGFACPT
jgi:hypothetical protein